MAPKASKSRRKSPGQLQRKIRQLQRSNRVKDALLNILSYELRTPLNVVMGYTAMMKDGMLGKISAEQEKALVKVIARVKDQLATINNILYTTSREDRKVKVETRAIDLQSFLSELRLAYDMPLEKDITISWHGPPEKTLAVTDSGKIKLILQNLIDNAIKFTPSGRVIVSVENSARWVEFKVEDTGIGISRERLPRLFESFQPTEGSGTKPSSGAGMGLYIVKSFTELLGGKVSVQSETGKGSTFTVTIPIS